VRNPPGQESWAPTSARLSRADGTPLEVRRVRMDRARLASGEEGLVAVELAPFPPGGDPFQLELLDREGERPLRLDGLKFRETR
jgi:hypothetical protein